MKNIACALLLAATITSNVLANGPYADLAKATEEAKKLTQTGSSYADDGVILQSQDGAYFVLRVREAKQSETLKNLLEDVGIEHAIPLPSVASAQLRVAVAFLQREALGAEDWKALISQGTKTALRDALLAVNYLDIKELLTELVTGYENALVHKETLQLMKDANRYLTFKREFIDLLPRDLRRLLVKRMLHSWPDKPVATISAPQLSTIEFSKDSRVLLTRNRDGETTLWSVEPGKPHSLAKIPFTLSSTTSQIGPVGNWTAQIGAGVGGCRLLHAPDAIHYAPLINIAGDLAQNQALPEQFSRDGKLFVVRSRVERKVYVYALEASENPQPIRVFDAEEAQFSPDGKWVMTWDGEQTLSLWPNPRSEHAGAVYSLGKRPHKVEFSPDGQWIRTRRIYNADLELWKVEPGPHHQPVVVPFSAPANVYGFSPDGKSFVTVPTARSKNFSVWLIETPPQVITLQNDQSFVASAKPAFSPDGKMIALGQSTYSNVVDIWSLPSGHEVEGVKPFRKVTFPRAVHRVEWSPDGMWLATFSDPVYLFAFPYLDDVDLASAQIIRYTLEHRIGKRAALENHLRETLGQNRYADELLFGIQPPATEPSAKKLKPE